MNTGLLDAFRHSAWANRELIAFCAPLTPDQLAHRPAGAYGNIIETLQHMIGSESFYRFLFTGDFLPWDWKDDELPTLAQLANWSAELSTYWEELLSQSVNGDAVVEQVTPQGVRRVERTGIVLAQVLHHGNVHREQIATVLTSLGLQPPDLDVWVYSKTITG